MNHLNSNLQMKLNDFDNMEINNDIRSEFKEWVKDKNNLDMSELEFLMNEKCFKSLIIECLINKGYEPMKYPYGCSLRCIIKILLHSDYGAIAFFIKYKFSNYLSDFKTLVYNLGIIESYNIDKQMIYRLILNHLLFVNETEFRKLI